MSFMVLTEFEERVYREGKAIYFNSRAVIQRLNKVIYSTKKKFEDSMISLQPTHITYK